MQSAAAAMKNIETVALLNLDYFWRAQGLYLLNLKLKYRPMQRCAIIINIADVLCHCAKLETVLVVWRRVVNVVDIFHA